MRLHPTRTLPLLLTLSLVAGCGDDGPAGNAVEFTVPTGGGSVTVPVGDTAIELTFPASAAGRTVTLTPTTAASIGYPAEDVEAALALAPAGTTFDDPVLVRPASGEPLVAHVPTAPGPQVPELLALSDDGSALLLNHFSTIAVMRLSRFPGWGAGTGTCTSGSPRAFLQPSPLLCNTVAVDCCASGASATCRLGAASLRLSFARLTTGAGAHCGGSMADAGTMDMGGADAGLVDAGPAIDAGPATDAGASDMGSQTDAGAPTDMGPAGDAGTACPGTAGPSMVRVPAGFCVDSTEVTSAQYDAFLTARGSDVSGQPASCAANTTFAPDTADFAGEVTQRPNHPVGWVDWCDAYAYCEWAGKRLCGRIGGGPNAQADFIDATRSQWYYACSQAGGISYPYSGVFDLMACNTRGSDGSGAPDGTTGTVRGRLPVGSLATCQGGYPGLYDMSGNTLEWTDECAGATFSSVCQTRGGNSFASDQNAQCWWNTSSQRSYTYEHLGFRCCAD